jgi:hypothetical protein
VDSRIRIICAQLADRETDPNTLSIHQTILAPIVRGIAPAQSQAGPGGEFAMPASIIRPVAASYRHFFRVHGRRALRLFPAVALLLCAFGVAAAEAPGQLSLEKNSFYLSSAGFRIQVANDPAGQKALRALPAHRFVVNGAGETVRYFYAEPQHCVCIFVGTQQAYDNYFKLLSEPLKPTDDVAPDYKTQAGVLLSGQPLRQSTRGDPTTLSDYLSTLYPRY